jgi:hypothetical protein
VNAGTLEERVREAGRHFVVEYGLFLVVGPIKLFAVEEDHNFDDNDEFKTESTRIQGQLRDVLALLPEEALAIRQQGWIAGAVSNMPSISFRLLRYTVRRWYERAAIDHQHAAPLREPTLPGG